MSLNFLGTGGLAATLAVGAVALALAWFLYRRVLSVRHGKILLALRMAAAGTLVLFLARPVVSWERTRLSEGRIIVLVDTSRSMSIRDAAGGSPRIEAARETLGSLLPRLEDMAPVEISAFDAAPRRVSADGLPSLSATGEGTDLAAALRAALETPGKKAAVIVLSDGQETGKNPAAEVAAAGGVPVHTVALGSPESSEEFRDGAIAHIEVDRTALVNTRIAVRADVRTQGYGPMPAAIEIRRGDQVVTRKELTLPAGRSEALLAFTPGEPGVSEYEVRLVALPEEKVLENNSQWFVLEVTADRVRVLYYEGTPRWEYRYAKKALSKDANLLFSGLLRTNADRVYQQGSAEMTRLPETADALAKIQVVILGDIGRDDLTADQAAMLRKYVEDGGGLFVAGGRRLFGPDGLRGSALDAVLPLALSDATREMTGTLAVEVAREGASHPALLGLPAFLPVDSVFTTAGARPGAMVLATAGGEPLITVQRYGSGRVLLLATDTDWKWCTSGKSKGGEELFERMWGQAVRWLAHRENAADGAGEAAHITTDRRVYAPGETVRISVRGMETVKAVVETPGGAVADVPLATGDGTFLPQNAGPHFATCGDLRTAFFVQRNAREMEKVTANTDLLQRLAAQTNGSAFTQETATNLPAAIARSTGADRARGELTVDNSPWLFFVFVIFIGADWTIRKWLQLV